MKKLTKTFTTLTTLISLVILKTVVIVRWTETSLVGIWSVVRWRA